MPCQESVRCLLPYDRRRESHLSSSACHKFGAVLIFSERNTGDLRKRMLRTGLHRMASGGQRDANKKAHEYRVAEIHESSTEIVPWITSHVFAAHD
jgi:hypothetical protein